MTSVVQPSAEAVGSKFIRLRDVADLAPGVPGLSRENAGREVSFLSLDRIWSDQRFDASDVVAFSGDVQSYNPVAEGDLLVPKVSPTFAHGRTAIAQGLRGGLALATSEVFVLRPRDSCTARFLKYRLIARDFLSEGVASWAGVGGLKRVSADFIKSVRISEAAWQRQREIADYLDRETARIDALIAKQERLIEILRERRSAVPERLLADAPYRTRTVLKHVASSVRQGWSPQCESEPVRDGRDWAVLKVGCVNGGRFRPGENKRLPPDIPPRPETVVRKGDLVISRANTRELVGSAAVVPGDYPNLMLSDKLYALRLDERRAVPEYVNAIFATRAGRDWIELAASGASPSMQNVSRADLLELPISLPDVREQRLVVGEIDERTNKIDLLISKTERFIELSRERRSALITAAVTGQIDVSGAA